MSSLFQFSRNDLPTPRKRVTPILSVGATDQIHATVISETVWGIDTHWWRGTTVPHKNPAEECGYCREQAPRKWRGYLHVVLSASNDHGFIELTDFSFERLMKVKGERETLRGLVLCFARERKTVKAPVVITLISELPQGRTLPKVRTPEETLKRLWKLPG